MRVNQSPRITIELKTPSDSRTLFRVLVGESELGQGLTAIQTHLLVGELLCRPWPALREPDADMSEATEHDPPRISTANSRFVFVLLSFATFVIGLGATVVVGLLSPVAADFHIPVSQASWLMTVYALTYAVTSPLLGAAIGLIDRSLVIAVGLAIFLFGALLAATAPSFSILLFARAIMAIGGGLTAPLLASVGAILAPNAQRGRALSIIFAGFTLAQVLGVPAGAWLGYAFGWRASFAIVVVLSVLGCGLTLLTMPRNLIFPPTKLSTLAEIFSTPRLLVSVSFSTPFVGGIYVLYTFLAPFLETKYELGREGVTSVLALYGVAAVLGNGFGGLASDRIGAARTLAVLCLVEFAIMPCLTWLPTPTPVGLTLILIWGVASWAFFATQQSRLAARDPDKTLSLFALNSSAVYLGGAIGPPLGAIALKTNGIDALGSLGALMMVVALAFLAVAERLR
jgi:MFS transporter, DHA1 family, inner membrane transport protein